MANLIKSNSSVIWPEGAEIKSGILRGYRTQNTGIWIPQVSIVAHIDIGGDEVDVLSTMVRKDTVRNRENLLVEIKIREEARERRRLMM